MVPHNDIPYSEFVIAPENIGKLKESVLKNSFVLKSELFPQGGPDWISEKIIVTKMGIVPFMEQGHGCISSSEGDFDIPNPENATITEILVGSGVGN